MKYFSLVLLVFLSNVAIAMECNLTGQVSCPDSKQVNLPPPPQPYHRRYAYDPASKISAGVELGAGAFPDVSRTGNIGGLGILGDYHMNRQLDLEGRMMFSNYNVNTPYYYGGYGYYGYNQGSNYNQVDLTVGPNYRLLRTPLSPVVGAMLGYAHRYFNSPTYTYGYGNIGTSDSAEVGGLVGLDYQVSRSVSVGLDLRYMVPFASTNNGVEYTPVGYTPIESLNYYVGGAYVKFSF